MEPRPMPLTLIIDTAEGGTSLALGDAARPHGAVSLEDTARQSEQLVIMLERLLKDAGKTYADLGQVVANIGPGSFTGIRVGLAVARALGLALSIPVHGVTGLQRTAHAVQSLHPGPLVVIQEALRGQCYWQPFDENGNPTAEPGIEAHAVLARRFGQARLAGSGVASLIKHGLAAPQAVQTGTGPDASAVWAFLVRDGGIRWQDGLQPPRPLYIREPDAKLPTPFLHGNDKA
ncbi:tRNA (adenosine(37)-N6)-threonylcarbamoyltransferase complex dimerization subunit type 1 TsaB [bacterium]|nr:tRNA (adenosine(37)-N6)-threonylcarbamoyltransferase complex dimerization subunit type 1 TsaB [bacterium]